MSSSPPSTNKCRAACKACSITSTDTMWVIVKVSIVKWNFYLFAALKGTSPEKIQCNIHRFRCRVMRWQNFHTTFNNVDDKKRCKKNSKPAEVLIWIFREMSTMRCNLCIRYLQHFTSALHMFKMRILLEKKSLSKYAAPPTDVAPFDFVANSFFR